MVIWLKLHFDAIVGDVVFGAGNGGLLGPGRGRQQEDRKGGAANSGKQREFHSNQK
jgi:hypothetical protein